MMKQLVILSLLLLCNSIYANYGSTLCRHDPQLTCHKVKRHETWESLFPNPDQRDMVKRINRMGTDIYRGMTIAVPVNMNASAMDFAPMDKQIPAPGKKEIIVSLHDEAFGAYNPDGSLQYWGPVSSARGYCPDLGHGCHTPTGVFAIYQKEGPGCVSHKFPLGRGGAPMPYCMYFHGGFALHGSYEVPGYNASHGCIRMFVEDAKWLNLDFTADSPHTTVIVNP